MGLFSITETSPQKSSNDEQESADLSKFEPSQHYVTDAIEVSGFKSNTTEELLSLFFESKRETGGVKTSRISLDKEDCTALVVFHSVKGKENSRV